jgi:multiple sugar transport system permease protein/sn-glycerol 3-phosphate transport system permease protein
MERSGSTASAVALQRTRRKRPPFSEWLLFLLFIAPNFILFSVFTYWPMIQTAYLSGVRWDMISPTKRWVGADNYRYLWEDDTFRQVLINSFWFAIGAVGGSLVLGLSIALLLNQKLRFRNFARASVFLPTLLSGAAIGIVWVYIFDPRYGILAGFLKELGVDSPDWLGDPEWALPAVIIVYIWKNVGLATVIFLAGLQSIPRDLYEAATVDGAGAMSRFRNVTLPMLSPIMFFVVVTSILNSFQAFDIINVMTRGGPVDATNILIYYIYEQGFVAFNAGRAGAASMILFVIMLTITLMQLRFSERRVHYGG